MPYQITLTNGYVLTTIPDDAIDTTTSLSLVGHLYPGYGTIIANNFVRLLENAANQQAPTAPLTGQLWYDTTHHLMMVWNGSVWFSVTAVTSVLGNSGDVTLTEMVTGGLAPLNAPALTGIATAPTANVGTSTNQIATTAFVINQVGRVVAGVSSVIALTGNITLTQLVTGGLAPLNAPALTGIPTAPTAPSLTATTQLATTAFVQTAIGSGPTGLPATGVTPGTYVNATVTVGADGRVTAISASLQRTLLTANLNLYVATTGSDTANTGLTLGSPFLTIQAAVNSLYTKYDLNSYSATINIAAGTYTAGANFSGAPTGGNSIAVTGAGSSTIISITSSGASAFGFSYNVGVLIQNMTIQNASSSTNSGHAIVCNQGAEVIIGAGMTFGPCTGYHLVTQTSGNIVIEANYTISGNFYSHWVAEFGGTITAVNCTATITTTVGAYSGYFAQAIYSGTIYTYGMTFTGGSVVGTYRYAATQNGVITTGYGGANYFPGSAAGVTAAGGQYS